MDQFHRILSAFPFYMGNRERVGVVQVRNNINNKKRRNPKQTNPIYHLDFLHKLNSTIPYGKAWQGMAWWNQFEWYQQIKLI